MSKERLEEFREFIDFMYESIDIEDHQRFIAISESMLKDGWFKWIYRFAKEQTERVQELESHITKMAIVRYKDSEELDDIHKQNKCYRELVEEIQYQSSIVETSDNVSEAIDKALGVLEGDPHD